MTNPEKENRNTYALTRSVQLQAGKTKNHQQRRSTAFTVKEKKEGDVNTETQKIPNRKNVLPEGGGGDERDNSWHNRFRKLVHKM